MVAEDRWIPTTCGQCYSLCALRVHRVNGTVVKIEGNPDSAVNRGRICSRGLAGIMTLYDPNRVNVPLKRTNPKKGLDVDPGWVEITWDEALDTVAARLKKIRQEDPRKLLFTNSATNSQDEGYAASLFTIAYGTPHAWVSGAGNHCGNAEHLLGGLMGASWCRQPDVEYCRYLLNFGTTVGFGTYYCVSGMAQRVAQARVQGMRHVAVDPFLSPSAEKADEWLPIRPGTDGAMALAMLYVLLHELDLYDGPYLKRHTNAPYLVGDDGLYVRDPADGPPLVLDPLAGQARPFNDPAVQDFALEGEVQVQGRRARPAFAVLKEHLRSFTPEWAEPITTIPAATIRRIAREYGEAARIGSTIVIDGKVLPYRPVAAIYFKGAQGHKNALLSSMAIELLVEVVGAANVPGGLQGMNFWSMGQPEIGRPRWSVSSDRDGLLVADDFHWPDLVPPPYPPHEVQAPKSFTLGEMFPLHGSATLLPVVMADPERFKLPYRIEMNLHIGSNFVMTFADPEAVAKAFQDVFQVSFSLFLDESTNLSDIVLPTGSYLERLAASANACHSPAPGDEWCYHIRQPVVEPIAQRRQVYHVLLDLAERLGMREELYAVVNALWKMEPAYALDPARQYSWEELVDRRHKNYFGEQHGLEWFKQHGVLKWPKQVEERYWKPFSDVRVPIYFECLKTVGQQVAAMAQQMGFDLNTSTFQPLPDWRPCRSHQETNPEYDLYAIYFKSPMQTAGATYDNPWLDEVCQIDRFAYGVTLNAQTARRKGIAEGDWVEITSSATGRTIRGRAVLTEGINPEVIALSGCGGHWSKHTPIASQQGRGLLFEWLMPAGLDNIDLASMSQDLCVKVRVARKG